MPLTSFEDALQIEPEFVLGLMQKGIILGNMKRYEEALECFDLILFMDPDNFEAMRFKNITNEFMS